MKQPKLLCLYHPTTAVFVDDDASFLKNITLTLNSDIPYTTFQDAEEALRYIKKFKNQNNLLTHTVNTTGIYSQDMEGLYPLNLKISKIFHECYSKKQYEEVSVIVVDYSMPKINGAEFFEKIADIPIKKLMLTGQADEAFAVKLFNSGIINKFILKGVGPLNQIINQSVYELQREYFQDTSNIILAGLTSNQKSCLNDLGFIDFFYKFCSANKISSYYLIDSSGSFLFLDNNGSPSWLLVNSESEALEFANQANAEGAPPEIVNAISSGEKLAYFCDFDQYVHATEGHWEKYLYEAKKIKGKQEYRYALTEDLKGFPLNKDKIFTFNKYLSLKK